MPGCKVLKQTSQMFLCDMTNLQFKGKIPGCQEKGLNNFSFSKPKLQIKKKSQLHKTKFKLNARAFIEKIYDIYFLDPVSIAPW